MNENEIINKLGALDELRQIIEQIRQANKLPEIEKQAEELETEIKAAVLALETPVKGNRLQAVINKGRVSWDAKLLEGYAVAHPEIKAARKEGAPTVTIRKV
jgi:cob(I)alamin adenosyltransferase